MRIRGFRVFRVVLATAVIGLAGVAAGGATVVQQGTQDQQAGPPPGPPPGPGGGPGGGGPGGIGRMLPRLNLTTAQLEQAQTLLASQRDADAAYQDQLRQTGDQMRSLVEADTFDEDAVRALAAKEAAAMTELRVNSARTEAAIYQLLTADQKKTLATLASRMPPRGRGDR